MSEGPPKFKAAPMHGDQPAWRHALGQAGLPAHVVLIDFETYFDSEYHMGIDKDALSTIEYVMDSRFEEVCHSIVHIKQPFEPVVPTIWWGGDTTYIRYLQREYGPNLENATVVGQNLGFDGTILARKYGINPPHCIDILGLARHEESRDHNDLASLCERWGLPAKGDTMRFKGLHLKPKWEHGNGAPKLIHRGMTPEEMDMMAEYCEGDGWREWHLFTHLMPRLSNPKVEAALMQHTLDMFWKPALRVDQTFAAELVGKMNARVDELVAKIGSTREEVSGNISFGGLLDKALTEAGDTIAKYQKDGKPKKDGTPVKLLAIAKDDPELETLQSHPNEPVRDLINARSAVKSWPLHIARVERIVNQSMASGGLLCNPLKYCGAHTGRWSGGEKINTQNMSSRNKEELINSIRGLLIPPENYDLVIVDASQIEARVTDWLAGETDWLEVWKDATRDPYCEFASSIVARPLRKARKTDPKPVASYYTKMRGMGKVGVLGCGYGMGADKAIGYAQNSYNVEMTIAEAVALVNTYRKTHPKVCKLWRVIEQKFKAAAKYGEPGFIGTDGSAAHSMTFTREGDITIITLPSGRKMKYSEVKVSIIDGREQLWMMNPLEHKRIYMWGGYLVENVVQAMSRDILGEAVLATEAAGYHVAHHVHDEIIAVVLKTQSKTALERITKILSTPPAWALDCPLAAEGGIKQRYGK